MKITATMRSALGAAAVRDSGCILPIHGIGGRAADKVVAALIKRGFATGDPVAITFAGRVAVAPDGSIVLDFEDMGYDTHLARYELQQRVVGQHIVKRLAAVRVKREPLGWRIDKTVTCAGTWLPWEAVDSVHYKTLIEAQLVLREHVNQENE